MPNPGYIDNDPRADGSTEVDLVPPLENALRELIRVSKSAGMNAASDFGYSSSQQQADDEEISEAVEAVYQALGE